MQFTILEPEVAGGWGPETIADVSVHPPRVARLHYEFDGWLGDPLLESYPCFIVAASAAALLQARSLTGFDLADVYISASPQFMELHPGLVLPEFFWLRVRGRPGVDDFALNAEHRLVVSAEALAVLRAAGLRNAEEEDYNEREGAG
jgi:hypothetical protein